MRLVDVDIDRVVSVGGDSDGVVGRIDGGEEHFDVGLRPEAAGLGGAGLSSIQGVSPGVAGSGSICVEVLGSWPCQMSQCNAL